MSGEWPYVCHCDMSLKKKTTVLLVDDHPGFLDEVSGLLIDEYKIVGTARDGRSALDAARKSHAEIILLDIEMPMLNGIEVARAIRQSGLTSKVVFLTMHADPDYVTAAFKAGAQGYIFKSHLHRDLKLALETVLANRVFVSRYAS
jgi:DNA-binding NarL/FixJ family response regulator